MANTLRHRGPDDGGTYAAGPVGLGQRRLSIIDLSDAGHQPMHTPDGAVTIVYNGELYNFPELRRRLEAEGVAFRSRSDTEVVLQAYVRWGAAAFPRFNGMFAIALWDGPAQTLHLVRDRFGIKPLYYQVLPRGIVFGSEIKAILASGRVSRAIHAHGLHEHLYYGNALGEHTLFDGIVKLLPGHHLTLSAGGCRTGPYWRIEDVPPIGDDLALATETVRQKLEESVARHLLSDVPVGVFLSGGIDSSAITALASGRSNGPLQTFSVGFDFERGTSELPKARGVAERFGTDHHELHIAGADMPQIIENLVRCHDEPFSDAANIPLYLLCEQLQGRIKVILQGDGGDEIFAGYRRYNVMAFGRLWRGVSRAGLAVRGLAPRGPSYHRLVRFFRAMAAREPGMRVALLLTMETLADPPPRYLSGDLRREVEATDPFARYRALYERLRGLDEVQRLLYTDTTILLPDTYLEKVDKSTMAHSIEVRVPFLDAELTTYGLGLPADMKVKRGQKKWILRRALRGILPDEILDAPKRGFGVPIDDWLRGPLADYARSVLFDHSTTSAGLLDRAAVEGLFASHVERRRNAGFMLYKLLNFCLWHRLYVQA